jgi:hypothetical protein
MCAITCIRDYFIKGVYWQAIQKGKGGKKGELRQLFSPKAKGRDKNRIETWRPVLQDVLKWSIIKIVFDVFLSRANK